MINFRAWDKGSQGYTDNKYLFDIVPDDNSFSLVSPVDFGAPDNLVIEMSTSLKDENGREIYEGDIVRVYTEDGLSSYTDTIVWGGEVGYPAFDIKNHSVEYDGNALSDIMNGGYELIEVIGNIHENPELLEVGR